MQINITAIIAALILSTLACQFSVGGPDPPGHPIPTSIDAANNVTHTWQMAINAAVVSGKIFILFDEVQLTTFLAKRLEASEKPVLLEPMVYLRQNSIQIFGVYENGPFLANVLLAITPIINEEGEISFELTTAEFGPIPVPETLKDTISAILTESFTGTFGPLATGIRITTLAIDEGEIAIVGELR
jgi:hypothetical protein